MDHGASSYRRFLDGDDSGLDDLIRDYRDGLVLYLTGIVGDFSLAEEAAEETFVKLFFKRPKDNGHCSFKTWLYTIGRNTARDVLRKRKRSVPTSPEVLAQLKEDQARLTDSYLQTETSETVRAAMERLKPEHKQILWLLYEERFSMRDAATIMHRSVHATESLAYRARQALKDALKEEEIKL